MEYDWFNNPAAISRRVTNSEAYRVYRRLLALDTNYFVFDRNHRDLKSAIEAFSEPDRITMLFDTYESETILSHMVRLLHNYLAAAKTLVEHTRTLINDWYEQTEFLGEYDAEIRSRFANNPLAGFVEDLRNYALHYSLPVTGFRLEVSNNPDTGEQTERVTFFIKKDTLLRWSNWSKGRSYLDRVESEIVIEELVDDYYDQVTGFHRWMHDRLEQIHAADLSWLSDMQNRINDLLGKIKAE